MVLSLFLGMGDFWADILLATEPRPGARQSVEAALAAYSEALERVLGAPSGSLSLMDAATLNAWMPAA